METRNNAKCYRVQTHPDPLANNSISAFTPTRSTVPRELRNLLPPDPIAPPTDVVPSVPRYVLSLTSQTPAHHNLDDKYGKEEGGRDAQHLAALDELSAAALQMHHPARPPSEALAREEQDVDQVLILGPDEDDDSPPLDGSEGDEFGSGGGGGEDPTRDNGSGDNDGPGGPHSGWDSNEGAPHAEAADELGFNQAQLTAIAQIFGNTFALAMPAPPRPVERIRPDAPPRHSVLPEKFLGKQSHKLRAFLTGLTIAFKSYPSYYQTNAHHINLALLLLEGPALDWFSIEISTLSDPRPLYTKYFEFFVRELQKNFGPVNERGDTSA